MKKLVLLMACLSMAGGLFALNGTPTYKSAPGTTLVLGKKCVVESMVVGNLAGGTSGTVILFKVYNCATAAGIATSNLVGSFGIVTTPTAQTLPLAGVYFDKGVVFSTAGEVVTSTVTTITNPY